MKSIIKAESMSVNTHVDSHNRKTIV